MVKALRVGYEFNIFDDEETSHISLKKTNDFVEVNGAFYPVYRGVTFEESQKVDALLDKKGGLSVSDYKVPPPFQETTTKYRDELAHYQAEMVNLCRDLGCEPSVAISDPAYYGDMASEAILNLQAERDELKKHLPVLDPKGNIVLENFGRDALVVRTGTDGSILPKALQPYVVAHGYEAETGEWAHGSYFSDLGHAYEAADPDIIEQASIRWMRDDLAQALEEAGVEPNKETIYSLQSDVANMSGWRDMAINHGNEMLSDYACDIAKEYKSSEKSFEKEKAPSLADRVADAKEVSAEFGSVEESNRNINIR